MLVAAYHMLRDGQTYRDLGEDFLDRRDHDRLARSLKRRLERLGYQVDLQLAA
jgi:hypothetical protein